MEKRNEYICRDCGGRGAYRENGWRVDCDRCNGSGVDFRSAPDVKTVLLTFGIIAVSMFFWFLVEGPL